MKNRSWFGILAGLAAGIVLAAPSARAQAEIDPDHFDSPNMVPFDRPQTKANSEAAVATFRYEGRFNLPYTVHCNGKSLRPGRYSISLRADGKVGQATLNQKETQDRSSFPRGIRNQTASTACPWRCCRTTSPQGGK